jgi:hypothetical protein
MNPSLKIIVATEVLFVTASYNDRQLNGQIHTNKILASMP